MDRGRPNGCLTGCLVGVAIAFFGAIFALSQLSLGIVEPPPRATATIQSDLTAHVSLDASHTTAVQEFSVSASAGAWLDGHASLDSGGQDVRLTILSGARAALTVASPTDSEVDVSMLQPGSYLAVAELVGSSTPANVEVTLTIGVHATFYGQQRSPVPSGVELRLEPIGQMTTRTVSVLVATYRETLQVSAGSTQRELSLALTGAARPVAAGGTGHAILTITPESHTLSGPNDRYTVSGAVNQMLVFFSWRYAGSGRPPISPPEIAGGDPTVGCRESGDACQADLTIALGSQVNVPCDMIRGDCNQTMDPGSPPEVSTVTFVVEVRDYLLDTPTAPEGATVTLKLAGAPTAVPTPTSGT